MKFSLRRIELIFIGITLAFICFMGGFFTGRSYSVVNIEEIGIRQVETSIAYETIETNTVPVSNTQSDVPQETGGAGNNNQDTPVTRIEGTASEIVPGALTGGDGKININTASKNELMDLPGIGPTLADNIITYRNNNGLFGCIEDIMNVSGIAQGRFDKIKDKITVQ